MSVFSFKKHHTDLHHADAVRSRTEIKRNILKVSGSMMEKMEGLRTDAQDLPRGSLKLLRPLHELLECTLLLSESLNLLTGGKGVSLYTVVESIERGLCDYARSIAQPGTRILTRSLAETGAQADEALLGNKAATLARLATILPGHVSEGFVVTTDAYHLLMEKNRCAPEIHRLLTDLDVITERSLFRSRTSSIRDLIEKATLPVEIVTEMVERGKGCISSPQDLWAVRSSCVGEGGHRTFAGQFDSFFGVRRENLAAAYLKVVASRYTDRAVYYRMVSGYREVDVPMAVLFMPMIEPRSSGVIYTRDPRFGSADTGLISSVPGPATNLLSGRVAAETFMVSRSSPCRVLSSTDDSTSLSGDEASRLFKLALEIEKALGSLQDIEWIIDTGGKIWIVQARPLVMSERGEEDNERPAAAELLIKGGSTVFPGWAIGTVFTPESPVQLPESPGSAMLVVKDLWPEIVHVLPYISGLISEQTDPIGNIAARVAEYGLPSIFGLGKAAETLRQGNRVLLDASACIVYPEPERTPVRPKGDVSSTDSPFPCSELTFNLSIPAKPDGLLDPKVCRSLHDVIVYIRNRALNFNEVSGS